MSETGAMEAMIYLRERLRDVEGRKSRHRPTWTQADMDAVDRLLERPAAVEQIALARIEGRSANANNFSGEAYAAVNRIARVALGLK